MHTLKRFVNDLKNLPSSWLLIIQLTILVLSAFIHDSRELQIMLWILGVMALLIIAKVIRQTPIFTALGLFMVVGALIFSVFSLMDSTTHWIQIVSHGFESCAYFIAAYGLVRYMFADRFLTKDELFAAGAVFTLIAWGFAFLYRICLIMDENAFGLATQVGQQSWLDLLYISFSLQSATGLSDVVPSSPLARVISIVQMFGGVMYLAVIVSRIIALQYIAHRPKMDD